MSATTDSGGDAFRDVFDRRTLNGEDYWVAPVVAHQEGVYLYPRANGGISREYLPEEELHTNADAWEDQPLTLSHPYDPEEDRATLTDNPQAEYEEVGLFRDVITNDGTLGGETWIEAAEVGEHNGALRGYMNSVARHGAGEVSTGYRSATEFERGTFNGEQYTYVQRDPQPDHLALLVNEQGNCSIEDGCGLGNKPNHLPEGVRMNHRAICNVRSEARTPEYSGTETQSWSDVSKTLTNFADAVDADYDGDTASVSDLSADDKSSIAVMTLLGESDADSQRELMMFPVVNPNSGSLNEGALDAVLGGRGSQADIPADAYESAERVARRLLEEEFDRDVRENSSVLNGESLGRTPGNQILVDEGSEKESDTSETEILKGIRAALNRLSGSGQELDGDSDPNEDDSDADDADPNDTMSDTIETLVNEYGISEEIAEQMEGTDCAENVLNWAEKANEADEDEDPEDGDDSDETADESPDEDETDEDETVNEELEELRQEVQNLKSELHNEDEITNRLKEEADLSDAVIEGMSLEAKKEVANSLADSDEEDDDDEDGDGSNDAVANFAGIPSQTDHDYEVDEDNDNVPVAGRVNEQTEAEGDD